MLLLLLELVLLLEGIVVIDGARALRLGATATEAHLQVAQPVGLSVPALLALRVNVSILILIIVLTAFVFLLFAHIIWGGGGGKKRGGRTSE